MLGHGLASYYARSLRGHRTASGEPYDPAALTAAHRTLPLGSCVLVERPEVGRSVRVRVNDRGPFVPGRVIDLSEAAARAIALDSAGVAPVRLFVCAAR